MLEDQRVYLGFGRLYPLFQLLRRAKPDLDRVLYKCSHNLSSIMCEASLTLRLSTKTVHRTKVAETEQREHV